MTGTDHSLESAIKAALLAALADLPVNRMGDGEAENAPVPHGWLVEMIGTDWGAKGREGREIRTGISIADRGDDARLATLMRQAEAALRAVPRTLGAWDHSGVTISRVRMVRRRDGLRVGMIDLRIRIWPVADNFGQEN